MDKESLLYEKQERLYSFYNDRLRWVIIFIESRYKKFPVPILNEIRAVQDHIARCYDKDIEGGEAFINDQMRAAQSHYTRCLLDGYKYIWYQFGSEVRKKYFWAKILGDRDTIATNRTRRLKNLRGRDISKCHALVALSGFLAVFLIFFHKSLVILKNKLIFAAKIQVLVICWL